MNSLCLIYPLKAPSCLLLLLAFLLLHFIFFVTFHYKSLYQNVCLFFIFLYVITVSVDLHQLALWVCPLATWDGGSYVWVYKRCGPSLFEIGVCIQLIYLFIYH